MVHKLTTGIGGVTRHHEQMVSFAARQLLYMVSPHSVVATKPEVLSAALNEGGANFRTGEANRPVQQPCPR